MKENKICISFLLENVFEFRHKLHWSIAPLSAENIITYTTTWQKIFKTIKTSAELPKGSLFSDEGADCKCCENV